MPKTNTYLKSPLWNLWFLLSKACTVMAQVDNTDQRSLAATLQNINGMSSIFSLLPVLSGKTQNVKAVAARTFPGTLTIAGLGAGRVLTKLQIGMLLFSADLYRNLVGELSYYHEEYVNKFSPPLIHIPTGTPERHSSNVIVNHNPTEDYMVEAWFQTQGLPAKVELSQTANQRAFCGMLIYLILYAFETFLSVQNAATGTAIPLIVLQSLNGICWVAAIVVLHITRGQGKRFIYLNRLATAEYRCFQLISSGTYVHSALFSTQLSNVREYNLFHSKYECKRLKAVGAAMIASATIDVIATVLVVGLNPWAYGWLGLQVTLIVVKVIFSLEPMRRIPIVNVQALVGDALPDHRSQAAAAEARKTRLPMTIETWEGFAFKEVGATHNVVLETATRAYWHSNTPGVFIGQPYYLQRPGFASEKHAASEESMPKLPQLLVPAASEKDERDEGSDPTIVPIPPSLDHCASPASIDTDYTVTPASAGFGFVTEVPRIVVSPESPEVASPISPEAPPGIPVARTLSAQTTSTRAPTPPAKSSIHRDLSMAPSRPTGPVNTIPRHATSPSRSRPDHSHHHHPHHQSRPHPHGQQTKQRASSPLSSPEIVRYLVQQDGRLTLSDEEPMRETNQALQREFLASLAEVVRANKVASPEFLRAVDTMLDGIRTTMTENWYAFGTTEVLRYMRAAREDIVWRRFV